ncbi:MAG: shikimate kinase [Methyloligellaceae bacterium]
MRFGFGNFRSRRRREIREQTDTILRSLGDKSIVLVGLMGAGKTSIGRRLAQRLNLPFTDADKEIEVAAGQTISEIFAEHGEAYFRDGEKRVIARLLNNGPQVLATGGGAYMNQEIRENIEKSGISVWLRASLETLLERTARRDHRPLLKSGDPKTVMQRLIEERYPVYAKAHIAIQSRKVPHEVIVEEIAIALRQKLEPRAESPS